MYEMKWVLVTGMVASAFSCASISSHPSTAEAPSLAKRSTASLVEETPSTTDDFAKLMGQLGRKVYFGNFHAHHFMGVRGSKNNPVDLNAIMQPGTCSIGKGAAFPEDDGRPCRDNAESVNSTLAPRTVGVDGNPQVIDYFRQACEYGTTDGKLDILFVTPHTKNNQKDEGQVVTSSTEEGVVDRAKLLKEINPEQNRSASRYCGLGQEASSISAGNHVNIFGQFKTKNSVQKPFFFHSGAFGELYPAIGERIRAGEKIILQFNHPGVRADLWMGDLSALIENKKQLKQRLNDYGLDDFAPVGCMLGKISGTECDGVSATSLTVAELKATYEKIRSVSGNPFRLIEVIPPSRGGEKEGEADGEGHTLAPKGFGPTSNSQITFPSIQDRTDANSIEDGVYDWIYYLSMGFRLAPTANQDNHFMNYGSATASRTGVLAPDLKERSVLDALDKRRVFASEDVNARAVIIASSDSRNAVMGGVLKTSRPSARIRIAYQDPNSADSEAQVRLYYYRESDVLDFGYKATLADVFRTVGWGQTPGGRLKAVLPAPNAVGRTPDDLLPIKSGVGVSVTIPVGKGIQWVFAEIVQKGDLDKIWTAPIWIEKK